MNFKWKTVPTDEDGLLDIGKYYAKQNIETYQSRSNDIVWLKQELWADEPVTRRMNFDFSNRVWVFLNGQILYHGDHSFFLKGPFFQGTIDKKFISDAIYLPLKKGKNELLIGISAVADGWGIMSRSNKPIAPRCCVYFRAFIIFLPLLNNNTQLFIH